MCLLCLLSFGFFPHFSDLGYFQLILCLFVELICKKHSSGYTQRHIMNPVIHCRNLSKPLSAPSGKNCKKNAYTCTCRSRVHTHRETEHKPQTLRRLPRESLSDSYCVCACLCVCVYVRERNSRTTVRVHMFLQCVYACLCIENIVRRPQKGKCSVEIHLH